MVLLWGKLDASPLWSLPEATKLLGLRRQLCCQLFPLYRMCLAGCCGTFGMYCSAFVCPRKNLSVQNLKSLKKRGQLDFFEFCEDVSTLIQPKRPGLSVFWGPLITLWWLLQSFMQWSAGRWQHREGQERTCRLKRASSVLACPLD